MYVTTNIWETDELLFTEEDPSSGYYDDDENWVPGVLTEVLVKGSLQPFTTASAGRLVLPSGVKAKDSRLLYTKIGNLKTTKDVTNQLPSTTVIDDEVYFIEDKGDWSKVGTTLKHYAYLLVKSPQSPRTEDT